MTQRLKDWFHEWVQKNANPWCGICKSRGLHPDDQATAFATMQEALPYLTANAEEQAKTREYLKASRG